ncbi:MAG: hypothetical protein AAGM22_22855 [Acidobacteriota bacterium]
MRVFEPARAPRGADGGPLRDPRPYWEATPLDIWDGTQSPAVLLCGKVGPGKSTLSAQLMYQAVQARTERKRGLWVSELALFESKMGVYGMEARPRALWDLAWKVDVLAIDELGGARPSKVNPEGPGSFWRALADLVGDRVNWDRPTIANSNLGFAKGEPGRPALMDLCPQVADRFLMGEVVEVTGASQRGRGR